MRIVKVGVLAPTNKGIPLGVQGENSATQVEFDTRPWFREYPYGTVSAVARRDGDNAPYPLTLDVADGTAVWQVSDTDTAKAGEGAVELTMTSAGARVRSLTFKTLVTASLTDSPVDDDAWYGWLDKAVVKVDETVQSAQRKMVEVDEEWTGLKADVTAKVDECGKVAAQAAQDAHHAKVDAQATAKALESAEGSVAKAEAAANRAVNASIAADDSAVEASRSALSAGESADAAAGSAANAATSASEAATSAGNAADAASAASGSASAAAQSATDASNAKAAAQTAKSAAETAKSEAATSASNAATSADNAAKSASDAAKTLTEAKQYTDANSSNALVGSVSGNLLHVEDAWPCKPLSLTIDGAYKQDGTPSPENPVPIKVVEDIIFTISGKNIISDEMFVDGNIYPVFVGDGSLTLSFMNDYLWWTGTAENEVYVHDYYTSDYVTFFNMNPKEVGVRASGTFDAKGHHVVKIISYGRFKNKISSLQLERGNKATEYKPYVGASLPITLPAEHPYLAALPDGTHDEIVIDKYGNATLVARVQKVILNKWFQSSGNYYAHVLPSVWVTASAVTSIGIAKSQSSVNTGKIWFGSAKNIVAYTPRDGDTLDSINAIGISGYFSQGPVTYNLGKLDIPSLPETISNVWTDAELTTNMSMTYKRDINVAFDNLVQAVVASAAGE